MEDAQVKLKKAMHNGTTVPIKITFGLKGDGALDDVKIDPAVAIVHHNSIPAQSDDAEWDWDDKGYTATGRAVHHVVIQFKDTNQTWFNGSYKKQINAAPAGGHSGSHRVHVPGIVGSETQEYLVIAYDAHGDLLYAVDPDVVTEDP